MFLTLQQALEEAEAVLHDRREAIAVLTAALHIDPVQLMGWPETVILPADYQRFRDWLTQRSQGVPLAYLSEQKEFWSLPLRVTSDTLVPRPETECLVETILQRRGTASQSVLDIGTGSGAIALALAKERPEWTILATDISAAALQVAIENARRLDLPVQFRLGDAFQAVPNAEKYDIIVSNPPYVSHTEWENAPHLHHEPYGALVAEEFGLAMIRRLFEQAPRYLKPGGVICVEHGYQQQSAVQALAAQFSYSVIDTIIDALGHPRVCWAQLSGNL